MNIIVDLQIMVENICCPDLFQCEQAIQQVFDTLESAELKAQYRDKQGATNVLSFPFESPVEIEIDLLGDLVICAPLVIEEANQQNKTLTMHWSHLIAHGCLHLLGYDHIDDEDAREMEALECQIMKKLGFPDPYKMIEPL